MLFELEFFLDVFNSRFDPPVSNKVMNSIFKLVNLANINSY